MFNIFFLQQDIEPRSAPDEHQHFTLHERDKFCRALLSDVSTGKALKKYKSIYQKRCRFNSCLLTNR